MEFTAELRAIETAITALDATIAGLQAELRAVREQREQQITQLRERIRASEPLPLFEPPADEMAAHI